MDDSTVLVVGDVLDSIFEDCGHVLYEHYLKSKESEFIAQRTLQDLKLLISLELPHLDGTGDPSVPLSVRLGQGWVCEGEPTPPPMDTWARASLPTRPPTQPRRDHLYAREKTPAEVAAEVAFAGAEAKRMVAEETARREAALARSSTLLPPTPQRHLHQQQQQQQPQAGGASTAKPRVTVSTTTAGAAAALKNTSSSSAAAAAAFVASPARTSLSRERRVQAQAAQTLEKRVAGKPYTLDERGGITLIERVDAEYLPPISPQALSAVEGVGEEGGGRRGGGGGGGGGGTSVRFSHVGGGGSVGGGGVGGGAGSVLTGSQKSRGGRSTAAASVTLSVRQDQARNDPRYFQTSVTLPQPSIAAAFAAHAEGMEGLYGRGGGGVEASPPPSHHHPRPNPPLSISPGVTITEAGRRVPTGGQHQHQHQPQQMFQQHHLQKPPVVDGSSSGGGQYYTPYPLEAPSSLDSGDGGGGGGGGGGEGGMPRGALDSEGSMYSSASAYEREKGRGRGGGGGGGASSHSNHHHHHHHQQKQQQQQNQQQQQQQRGGGARVASAGSSKSVRTASTSSKPGSRGGKGEDGTRRTPSPILDGTSFQLAMQIERSKSGLVSSPASSPGLLHPASMAPASVGSFQAGVHAGYNVLADPAVGFAGDMLHVAAKEAELEKRLQKKPYS